MSIWNRLSRIFTVDDSILDEDFTLTPEEARGVGSSNIYAQPNDAPQEEQDEQAESGAHKKGSAREDSEPNETDKSPEPDTSDPTPSPTAKPRSRFIKPRKIGARGTPGESGAEATDAPPLDLVPLRKRQPPAKVTIRKREAKKQQRKKGKSQAELDAIKQQPVPEKMGPDLQVNRALIEKIYHLPTNADVIIRDFTINCETPISAFAVFMEGLSDKTIINSHLLEPLMLLSSLPPGQLLTDRLTLIKEKLLPGNQVMEYDKWEDVRKNILTGSTAVFVDGMEKALLVETKGWEHRGVSDTKTESVVRGPHDAFTENLRSNTGLVRSRIRTEHLITEMLQVGVLAPTDVAVMYVEGVVNPKLVQEVKRRIQAITIDFLQDSGTLEQFIEDPPAAFMPKMMATERPDRVAMSLAEGFITVFVGQSPYALILPTMFWSLMQTAEDAYLRFPFGSAIRMIRFIALFMALMMPAVYIAMTNYHPEMIPTDLMLSIAAAREKVPFPAVLEVLLMEFSIELIREAGIRIPNVIGPTIGIVGALILGQAAVQAGVISPLLVIVVAVTALASFTLPNYNMSFAIRTLRFVFILASALWGFYGITLAFMVLLMHWVNLKSFGVHLLSPVSPKMPASNDVIFRGPVTRQERRPGPLRPLDKWRQQKFNRTWAANVRDSQEARAKRKREAQQPGLLSMKSPIEQQQEEGDAHD